ncbi:MAG: hypothetical protein IPP77_03795 [Bacteroidetes bacterium]|nr:hypothetical protein [Bacteroidota bacterium]
MGTTDKTKQKEISNDDLLKEYDATIAAGYAKFEKSIKQKIGENEMSEKIIIINNDLNKVGRENFIQRLKDSPLVKSIIKK